MTADAEGSYDSPAHCSLPTIANGSSCPGSPTNSARSKSPATASSASDRIWYASSTIACRHGSTPLTCAHFAAVEMTTSSPVRSPAFADLRTFGRSSSALSYGSASLLCRRPTGSSGFFSASRSTRSSTCAFVWAMTISGRPASASSSAARTTSVDLPAPGGESTTTPRCAPCRVSRRIASVARAASAPGSNTAVTGRPPRSRRRAAGRRRSLRAVRRASTASPPGRAASRRPAARARRA